MADQLSRHPVPPLDNETAREYTERLNEVGISSYAGLERYFGYSQDAAKGMWLASERFNAQFSYEEWSKRRKSSVDVYGPTNWLRRKYLLTDEQAATVSAEFEQGNRDGLLKILDFKEIARKRVVADVVEQMERKGAFE